MTAETKLPTAAPKPAKKPKPSTAIINVPPETAAPEVVLLSVTATTIKRFESFRALRVADIHDKGQLKAVHDARMELVKARTTVDKVRKEMNDDHQREIKLNNEKAKGLIEQFAPIEKLLTDEETRVETALESERVAEKTAKLNTRKASLAAIVVEFTDMLAMYPDEFLGGMPESAFKPLCESLEVQVSVRKMAAETQRKANEAAATAAAEQIERDRLAEVERIRLRAIEDAERKAEAAKLEADREEFARQSEEQEAAHKLEAERIRQAAEEREKEAAEVRAYEQSVLDAERAEFNRLKEAEAERVRIANEARERQENERRAAEQQILDDERAELARQRAEIAAEQKRQDEIRGAAERETKVKADDARLEARCTTLAGTGIWGANYSSTMPLAMRELTDAEFDDLVDAAEARESQRQIDEAADAARVADEKARAEAMRPDVDKLSEWVDQVALMVPPAVSPACEAVRADIQEDLECCAGLMRERLT